MIEFKRDSVIALYLAGKPQMAIVTALQYLNVNKSFVSRTSARYFDTGSVASRPKSGRKKNGNNARNDPKSKSQLQWMKNCSELNTSP